MTAVPVFEAFDGSRTQQLEPSYFRVLYGSQNGRMGEEAPTEGIMNVERVVSSTSEAVSDVVVNPMMKLQGVYRQVDSATDHQKDRVDHVCAPCCASP